MKTIIPRDVALKWIKDKMQKEYSITIFSDRKEFPEKFIRSLKEYGWDFNFIEDKIIVRSNDPMSLAKLTVIVEKQGFFVSE